MKKISQTRSITTIEELRTIHDERFIRSAYRTILGREADAEGLGNYMRTIRSTLLPPKIIEDLRYSIEGLARYKSSNISGSPQAEQNRNLYYFVDHTVQCPGNTGVQRVARRLAAALMAIGEVVKFVKWDSDNSQFVLINKEEYRHLAEWHGPKITARELSNYPDANEAAVPAVVGSVHSGDWLLVPEVTHIGGYQSQLITSDLIIKARQNKLKVAFIFYDATPLRRPELKPMAKMHENYMRQLILADLIVPISDWSAADFVSFLKLREHARLTPTPCVVPLALPGESHIAKRVTDELKLDSSSTTILSVGSIVPHKNQVLLVHAFDRYCQLHPDTPWKLNLVGNLHPDLSSEIINATRSNSRINYLGDVSDSTLEKCYIECAFTVFPSVMEGFGLPILESLWFGKPTICANFGAMAEVAQGGGCLVCDTREIDELFNAVTSLIQNPEQLSQLSREAKRRPIRDWIDYANDFKKILNQVADPVRKLGHVYYWIDHTCTYFANSGIQRVARGLARSLLEQGVSLIPVKWNEEKQCLFSPSADELDHFSKWNGPDVAQWTQWIDPTFAGPSDWLVIPELTHYLARTSVADIHAYAKKISIRCAWVFYDAIPWKMDGLYPPEAKEAHRRYMLGLNDAHKVFAISEFSCNDLLQFITGQAVRSGFLENRIIPCVLPGEFTETARVTCTKEKSSLSVKILCVGTVEPRKNHVALLAAYLEARQNTTIPIELVIAGGNPFPSLTQQVEKVMHEAGSITWIKAANDAQLLALYSECDFTIYPSLEEGFGLPILESLWNARPCICASFGAMAEVARGGGCLTVDVSDTAALGRSILELVQNKTLLERLKREAMNRDFKTWYHYGREIAVALATERYLNIESTLSGSCSGITQLHEAMPNLEARPLLSICISTYNRAGWLALNLKNLMQLVPIPSQEIEFVIVDNTSTDSTPEVVQPYLHRSDFHYFRNRENVGMLGNLRVTAGHARGAYVWILGDDDLVKPGGIETVIAAIRANPGVALVYLNYAYTRIDDANEVTNLTQFLSESTPIMAPCADMSGTVREVCTQSENFFTAIYCLIFRCDHAIRAYSQDTSGRPFSTMLTCIPTTYYVLNHMIDEPAYWIGEPQLVVNLNVSWMRYAPLWILERIPEVYDTAEKLGANPILVDKWRVNNMPGVVHFFKEIFLNDVEGNGTYFSVRRLVNRLKHVPDFQAATSQLIEIYEIAHLNNHPLAMQKTAEVFSAYIE